jgi:hypothetical protein
MAMRFCLHRDGDLDAPPGISELIFRAFNKGATFDASRLKRPCHRKPLALRSARIGRSEKPDPARRRRADEDDRFRIQFEQGRVS